MAEISGMHWTYIGQVERGERNLTLASIESIAKAFRIKITQLFRGIRLTVSGIAGYGWHTLQELYNPRSPTHNRN